MCRYIDLITVFDALYTGRPSDQKLQCLYGNPMANNSFPKLNFTKFSNRNVKIVFTKFERNSLARRRSVLLIFPIFHTFVCFFFPAKRAVYPAKFKNKCMEIRKLTS